MSRLDNADNLEKQLADLQLPKESISSNRLKKIPPAVPPKKKAQPQVPHIAVINTFCEPSYSLELSTAINNNNHTSACNTVTDLDKFYANVSRLGKPECSSTNKPTTMPSQRYGTNFKAPLYQNTNDVPSPPPPPPPPLPPLSSLHCTSPSFHSDREYLSPPSPVSSNYSELVRATANMNYHQPIDTPIYQNHFQGYETLQSSTNESFYEPINPLPHINQACIFNQQYRNNIKPNPTPLAVEKEVDALTNLLVQSISDSQDLDIFGICVKCSEKVVGESSGCTAMGKMYHVKCFSCYMCNNNLQDKPFYAVENQPYCETDYYETLEKCCVCNKPILDRILRATGKPYHPKCFTCVECGKSLDGIPFTVDALNKIYCVDDFHKKFAPLCSACGLPIMPEDGEDETVRVVALDRSFHVQCYRCEDCGLLLSSEAEGRGCYPLDERILCKNCNALRVRLLPNVMTTDL